MRILVLLLLTVTASAQEPTMDLPIVPPQFVTAEPFVPEDEDEDDGEDPRDTPPPVIYGEEIDTTSDTIIYVIDRSWSMNWGSKAYITLEGSTAVAGRMERAKAEVGRSIQGLAANLKFTVVSYSCSMSRWKRRVKSASAKNKAAAISWCYALKAGGGTATGPAVALALSLEKGATIVLLTDGVPGCGGDKAPDHRKMISSANSNGSTVNVFGIAATGKWKEFCQQVASDSGGSYYDVP